MDHLNTGHLPLTQLAGFPDYFRCDAWLPSLQVIFYESLRKVPKKPAAARPYPVSLSAYLEDYPFFSKLEPLSPMHSYAFRPMGQRPAQVSFFFIDNVL
jgi:hypothetical protein